MSLRICGLGLGPGIKVYGFLGFERASEFRVLGTGLRAPKNGVELCSIQGAFVILDLDFSTFVVLSGKPSQPVHVERALLPDVTAGACGACIAVRPLHVHAAPSHGGGLKGGISVRRSKGQGTRVSFL